MEDKHFKLIQKRLKNVCPHLHTREGENGWTKCDDCSAAFIGFSMESLLAIAMLELEKYEPELGDTLHKWREKMRREEERQSKKLKAFKWKYGDGYGQKVQVVDSLRPRDFSVPNNRSPNKKGVVINHHDSHGLCFEIQHEDETVACYDSDELRLIC